MEIGRPALMEHQRQGVAFQAEQPAAYLCCDRGTGKTAMALANMSALVERGLVKRILYVAPLSTLDNIVREAYRFTDNVRARAVFGSRVDRERMLKNPGVYNCDVINFDALRILPEALTAVGYDAMVIDEASRIKERRTQVAQIAILLGRRARYRRCLSGMPFTEGVEDLWSQFYFLDATILGNNFFGFRNKFCVMAERRNFKTGKKFHTIVGYHNLDELERRVSGVTFRVRKEDCLDLPPKTYQVLKIKMLEEQEKAYRRVMKTEFSDIGDHEITHAMALTKIAKLRQVAAGFLYDDDHEPVLVPTAKYGELRDLFTDTLYGSKKMVVFTAFKAEPDMVEACAGECQKPIKVFRLPENPAIRQSCVDAWKAWKQSPAILVANVRSGGTGLNLEAADTAVFVSNDWRMEDRVQAEDRIHRMGSEIHSKITIVDIVTEDSVEEDILQALKEKKDLVDVFLSRMRGVKKGDVM
jgi:SNF2 family DNA or RNA helicase